jgi:hypothetical protein
MTVGTTIVTPDGNVVDVPETVVVRSEVRTLVMSEVVLVVRSDEGIEAAVEIVEVEVTTGATGTTGLNLIGLKVGKPV